MATEAPKDGCSWCGDDEPSRVLGPGPPRWFRNRRDEIFCSRAHMNASAAALRRLQGREPEPPEEKPQAGTFVKGDVVEVTSDTPELWERYFGGADGLWTIGLIFKTTEGLMASLTRVGQRRNVPTTDLRRVELPPALR